MGLLTLGLVLAGSVAGLELYIVHTFRPESYVPEDHYVATRWFWVVVYKLGPWIEKNPMNGLLFSLGLSIAVGVLFPAAGVAVMLAGIASTIMTQPVYMCVRKYRQIRDRGVLGSMKDYFLK